ncbi:DNA internalization-related competence protein ComEC/Rec2 [Castellaniella sp. GW247-6E4]|uniref:DNA internalization-related competence protein ComEC/Rec2 n=1 Tax=Castellaniella sp. GW247-6E4 TaxID=3140380 RepID=UPI00331645C1
MIGRLTALGFVAGVAAVHGLDELPSAGWTALAALSGAAAWLAASGVRGRLGGAAGGLARYAAGGALIWLAACGGFAWTVAQAQARLGDVLVDGNVNRVTRVDLRVVGLPRLDPDRRQFEAEVLAARPEGVPRRILVTWGAPGWRGPYASPAEPVQPFPLVAPGQIWRMALVTRPVRAAVNPHAFDYERHTFAQGIRATGTVRGTPRLLGDDPWASLEVLAQRARHAVREALRPRLAGMRYGPVLLALAIGDQDGVADEDWRVFNRSGITHLVSISGSHITMIAAFGGLAAYAAWRRIRWRGKALAEYVPAQIAAAWAALAVAWLYCLLAGWGVPARRTFMMLAVAAASRVLRIRLGGSRILALAAVAVLVLDPWAVLASGFWLSFGAVAVLLAVGARVDADAPRPRGLDPRPGTAAPRGAVGESRPGPAARAGRMLSLAVRAQMAVTLALMPPLAWLFHEVSVVSPLANAYAIPLVGWVITPLSLLAAACAVAPGGAGLSQVFASLGHGVLEAMMRPTEWLGSLSAAHWPVAAAPVFPSLVACAGAALALWPRGGRHRRLGWLALLPLLFWVPSRPAEGEWELYALDVGQGSALVLHTARRTLVFDAGPRRSARADEGARTLLPFLRAQGVRRLDVLVVSHGDVDHAGGVRSLLEGLPVAQSYSSFPLEPWLAREARKLGAQRPPMPLASVPCRYGASWRVDGVSFEFLWPLDQARRGRRDPGANASSCVLRVRGAHHTLLLTGDVEARSEAAMLARGLGPADVVVAAHHGSATSSSQAWVDRLGAAHVIVQAGAWNRHGHPAPPVVARWMRAGARLWRTDRDGAVLARSRAGGLSLYSVLESSRRYWHGGRLQ